MGGRDSGSSSMSLKGGAWPCSGTCTKGALSGPGGRAWLGRGSRYLGHLMDPAVGLAALQQLGRQIAVLPIELLKDKRRRLAQVAPRQGPCRPDWRPMANTETGGQSQLCSWQDKPHALACRMGASALIWSCWWMDGPCQAVLLLPQVGTPTRCGSWQKGPRWPLNSGRPQAWRPKSLQRQLSGECWDRNEHATPHLRLATHPHSQSVAWQWG